MLSRGSPALSNALWQVRVEAGGFLLPGISWTRRFYFGRGRTCIDGIPSEFSGQRWRFVLRPGRARRGLYSRGCRSEEHTSELQSLRHLVCRLLLEKKEK